MDSYDAVLVAGQGAYYFCDTLFELSTYVGILPPTFRGKMMYREHGTEKWMIKTTIPGRTQDPYDYALEYTDAYTDWTNSVEVAMQGAIAHICYKYRYYISRSSPYYLFGERSMDGNPIDRSGTEDLPFIHAYMTEREFGSVNLENLLKKQIALMDDSRDVIKYYNQRIQRAETAVLVLDDKKTALENRIKLLEEPQKMEERMIHSETWSGILEKLVSQMSDTIADQRKEKDQLKMENEELKKKLAELTADQKEEEPEERIMYASDGEEVPVDEWKKREASKEPKRRNPYPLACHDRVKRR